MDRSPQAVRQLNYPNSQVKHSCNLLYLSCCRLLLVYNRFSVKTVISSIPDLIVVCQERF